MIIGYREKLEKTLSAFLDVESEVERGDVLNAIARSVAVGDDWLIPVKGMEEGMNETDFEEERVFSPIPCLLTRTVCIRDGAEMACAFTGVEKQAGEDEDETVMSLQYPARDVLEEFSRWTSVESLLLNPWTDGFVISRADAKRILAVADSFPKRKVDAMRTYRIEPRFVIDTGAILRSWCDGWTEADAKSDSEKAENWKLQYCSVMADGRVLLLFEMRDEIYGGQYDTFCVESTCSHYRVLEYGEVDGTYALLGKYRFRAQNSEIESVFLCDGILSAAIALRGSSMVTILPMIPTNDEGQFKIYNNVDTVVSDSKGNVAVSYYANHMDEAHMPVMIFDSDGTAINGYKEDHALSCLAMNLDSEENVWFHLFPSSTLDRLGLNGTLAESCGLALTGFDSFALSDDRSKLFVSFSDEDEGSVQYVMSRNEAGDYEDPIRFDFCPTDKDGKRMKAKDCEVFGDCSCMKSWVVLNADGILYLYDINYCS